MNTIEQIVLTNEQEVSRIAKGYKLYNSGNVTQIEPNLFEVIGDSGDKYAVEDFSTDIEPIFVCPCADHSFRQVICKHIHAVEFYIMGL
jgi:hypothetical protein